MDGDAIAEIGFCSNEDRQMLPFWRIWKKALILNVRMLKCIKIIRRSGNVMNENIWIVMECTRMQ